MKLFQWFINKKSDEARPENSSDKQPCGCETDELNDFIKNFVVEETLEPAVQNAMNKMGDCGCGCGCDDEETVQITDELMDNVLAKAKVNIPQLEWLLAGHKAWCAQLVQTMREGKSSEYNLQKIGSELWCCIGQWLKCEGAALHNYAEYQDLLVSYQAFKQCATSMLDSHQRGYLMDVIVILRGDFASLSLRVQEDLQALVEKVRSETSVHNDAHLVAETAEIA